MEVHFANGPMENVMKYHAWMSRAKRNVYNIVILMEASQHALGSMMIKVDFVILAMYI